jgi:CheY-like chemotaxis protein
MDRIVLVVDDAPDLRVALEDLLGTLGLRAIVAEDGASALRVVAGTMPDVVVTDLRMPGVDGWRLVRELKGRPELARLPVIVFSGERPEEAGLPHGVRFVRKPSGESLVSALREALGTLRGRRHPEGMGAVREPGDGRPRRERPESTTPAPRHTGALVSTP